MYEQFRREDGRFRGGWVHRRVRRSYRSSPVFHLKLPPPASPNGKLFAQQGHGLLPSPHIVDGPIFTD